MHRSNINQLMKSLSLFRSHCCYYHLSQLQHERNLTNTTSEGLELKIKVSWQTYIGNGDVNKKQFIFEVENFKLLALTVDESLNEAVQKLC